MVVTSLRCGKFPTLNGVSAKREDARIGKAEFFAPEAYISPKSLEPPLIKSLSIYTDVAQLLITFSISSSFFSIRE